MARCPDCGAVVADFFDHVDLDCLALSADLSPTQFAVVLTLHATPERRAYRWPGGWWCTRPPASEKKVAVPPAGVRVPGDIRTLRCLEKFGLLARSHEFEQEWRDTRFLSLPEAAS